MPISKNRETASCLKSWNRKSVISAFFLALFHARRRQFADMGNILFWAIAVFAAGMTGFYIFRVFFYTFMGNFRSPGVHPHESPMVMIVPLLILAALSLGAGLLGPWANEFLGPVFGLTEVPHHEDALLEAIALIAGFGGILVAVGLYVTTPDVVEFAKRALAPIYDILFHKISLPLNKYLLKTLYLECFHLEHFYKY